MRTPDVTHDWEADEAVLDCCHGDQRDLCLSKRHSTDVCNSTQHSWAYRADDDSDSKTVGVVCTTNN